MALRPHQALGDLAVEPGIDNREELRVRGEFIAFLKQYGVIGLAIAVVIGGKGNGLVTAVGGSVVMPVGTFFLPGGGGRGGGLGFWGRDPGFGAVLGGGRGLLLLCVVRSFVV